MLKISQHVKNLIEHFRLEILGPNVGFEVFISILDLNFPF
jgi:hypothetical protein